MRRLVLRPGAIGDTIVSLPALEHLCREDGVDAELWVPARNVPLVRHVANVRSFEQMRLDLLEIDAPLALTQTLSAFDEVVSWYGTARAEFRSALSQCIANARFLPALPPSGAGLHAVDFYAAQVGLACPRAPRIPIERHRRAMLAVHPFSGSARKNWPLDNFKYVTSRMAEQFVLDVEWCVGPEQELSGAHRFATLDDVMTWLGEAALYIGNDSGITHLAAACGVPTVAVFIDSDARVWAPRDAVVVNRPSTLNEVFTAVADLFSTTCRT